MKKKKSKAFIRLSFKLLKEDGWLKVDTPVAHDGFPEELAEALYLALRAKTENRKCFLDVMYENKLDFNNFEIIFKEIS